MVSLSARATTQSALLALAVSMLSATAAQAKGPAGGFIRLGQETAPPRGFVEMCESGVEPEFCSPTHPMPANAAVVTAGLDAGTRDHRQPRPAIIDIGDAALSAAMIPRQAPLAINLTPGDCMAPEKDDRLSLGERVSTRITASIDLGSDASLGCAYPTASFYPALTPWQGFATPALTPKAMWQPAMEALAKQTERPAPPRTAARWIRPGPCAPTALASMVAAVSTQLCAFALPDPSPSEPDMPSSIPTPTALPEAALKALLKQVNRHVNARVRQRTDEEIFGVGELWRRSGDGNGAVGDCEDLAIEKRAELIAAGFPRDRLAFAVVYSAASGLHTILVARTDEEDVVLDGRTPYVTNWSDIPYSWLSVQSMTDPMLWYAANRATSA